MTISANTCLQPSLTKTLGFGYVPTLLMSAPPWVFACLFSVAVAWSSDRRQEKVPLHVVERSTRTNADVSSSSGISSVPFVWDLSDSLSASQQQSLLRDTLLSSSKQVHMPGKSAISKYFRGEIPLTISQLHRLLLMDQLVFPSPSRKTRSSDRSDQRFQSDWQHHRLVCLVR
jgi:hypothetical protein